uniref:Uncharacterized protein n=1 Tax=Neobodo designis TaxID=312471 RepID=A0A7S1MQU3_NEODS|mmetsp:Transcript_45516/g.140336  ORF Transcript_45516/g.140336 Transcript_45516/m.140336 type:complete len:226 (+) Transcript_45516:1-678(+)
MAPSRLASTVEPRIVRAPRTTIYCMYGVNRPTEVGFWYRRHGDADARIDADRDDFGVTLGNGDGTVPLLSLGYGCRTNATGGWRDRFGRVVAVEFDDPDGPRMPTPRAAPEEAAEINRNRAAEPADSSQGWLTGLAGGGRGMGGLFESAVVDTVVSSFERLGVPDPRGGVRTSDHVDIMGNHEMLRMLLHIATSPAAGAERAVPSRVISDIDRLVADVDAATADG